MRHAIEVVVGLGLVVLLGDCGERVRARPTPNTDVGDSTSLAALEPCPTRVGPGLSDQDVSEIEFLVATRDRLPIRSIERLLPVSDRLNRHGGEVRATTASACFCGHGSFFDLALEQSGGTWSIVVEGRWIC
jgi:hypothetical protein